MKHLGDITKISGYEVPVVDCVIGGSPCQDLSIAGKREGLDGERSGLFMEQIRIIKEMRENDRRNGRTDEDIRPRYMVWENVPGAFSSHGAEDFRIVLEETAKVADKDAVIPMPQKGKWTTAGSIVGDGWSIAWRVLDAQFWGTSDKPLPQRRRRIALVADFAGESAPEILFVRTSVSGNTQPCKQKRKETPSDVARGIGTDDSKGVPYTLKIRSGCEGGGKGALIQEDKSATLSTLQDQTLFQPIAYGIGSYHSNAWKSDNPNSGVYEADTSKTLDSLSCGYPGCNQGGMAVVQPVPQHTHIIDNIGGQAEYGKKSEVNGTLRSGCQGAIAYSIENHPNDSRVTMNEDGKVQALTGRMGTGGGNVPLVMEQTVYAVDQGGGKSSANVSEGLSPTLTCTHGGEPVIALDRAAYNQGKNAQFDIGINENGIAQTCIAKGPGVVCHASKASFNYIVRRLTPLECERLQGFPDGWTDIGEWTDSKGKSHKTSDAARYKALGNSIALPPWKWVLKRLCACYERDATMASLFDGIGGFPYIWERLNGEGSCLWASEIDEFPMAVTKARIGG